MPQKGPGRGPAGENVGFPDWSLSRVAQKFDSGVRLGYTFLIRLSARRVATGILIQDQNQPVIARQMPPGRLAVADIEIEGE